MKNILLAVIVLIAGIVIYIRIAPSDPDYWHINPLAAEDPGHEGVLLLPGPEARTYPLTPEDLIAAFDAVAMSRPRVTRLAGEVEAAHVTYVARTKIMRYPDYVSVKAVEAEGGAQLAVYSRQRFGSADRGVNRLRLQSWLEQLEASLG